MSVHGDLRDTQRARRPDAFLRMIRRSQRGRLKIYLGYCAGVGKTYQMLEEARRLQQAGVDVVAALVETHGRKETEAMLAGLEVLPRRRIAYHGIEIEELDLEAVLARRPTVALVDELAHTNVPGSPNAKRYQDVEAILAAGIHVISTVNVQHLESLYDTVERVTGVRVKERIPDKIVLEADQIVNVDLTPEDLRERLREGKVYTPERIEVALDHFFRRENLGRLRELTLRELASQIDSRSRDEDEERAANNPDQVMVCLSSHGPNSEQLLRYASRLAGRLNRNWYAVYVQTPQENPIVIDASTQRQLSNILSLAKQLGAAVFTYKGEDIVKTILQFAREYRVGHIVVGKSGPRVSWWQRRLGRRTVVERLMEESRGQTIVVLDTVQGIMPQPVAAEAAAGTPLAPRPVQAQPLLPDLHRSRIVCWVAPIDKEQALRELVAVTVRNVAECSPDLAWDAVSAREAQGSTFIGENVAIPHARVPGLAEPILGVGVARHTIEDPETGNRVGMLFLVLSPTEGNRYLNVLAALGRLAARTSLVERVRAATDPGEVYRLLSAET